MLGEHNESATPAEAALLSEMIMTAQRTGITSLVALEPLTIMHIPDG